MILEIWFWTLMDLIVRWVGLQGSWAWVGVGEEGEEERGRQGIHQSCGSIKWKQVKEVARRRDWYELPRMMRIRIVKRKERKKSK